MTVIATKNKSVLSSVLMDDANALVHDFNFAHGQTAEESSDTTYTIGQVVIWDTDHWQILKTTDTLDSVSTAATAGKSLGVVVGKDSLGDERSFTVGSGGSNVVILFQGPANVKEQGLVLDAGLSGAETNAAKLALAQAGLKLKTVASQVDVSFYGA